MSDPAFPYAGTDGHSGTDTSRQAADDHHDSAPERQDSVITLLQERGARGVTVVDVRNTLIPHHGTASRVLTVLHIAGRVLRLKESRDGAKIYVLPEFRMTRPVEVYRGTKAKHQYETLMELQRTVESLKADGAPSRLPVFQLGWDEALGRVLGEIYRYAETVAGVPANDGES